MDKIIDLTEQIIDCPNKINNILCTFCGGDKHTFESRLNRVNLSKGKYKKALIPIYLKIKNNQYKSGTYGFIFNKFTVILHWNNKKRILKTITFLKPEWRNNMKNLKVQYKIYIKRFYWKEKKVMEYKVIKQSELTSECWMIQMFGLEKCDDCEYLNTSDCGGESIRKKLLKEKSNDN